MPLCIIFESKKPIGFRIIPVFAYFAVYFVHFTASCWFLKTATLLNQFRIWNCPCIQIFIPWWTSEALSPILSLIPWTSWLNWLKWPTTTLIGPKTAKGRNAIYQETYSQNFFFLQFFTSHKCSISIMHNYFNAE